MFKSNHNELLHKLRKRIAVQAQFSDRSIEEIRLVVATKGQPVSSIQQLHRLGIYDFGENYVQEALNKISQLYKLSICWHFFGAIQSNKTRSLAQKFSWIHSIDREKTALRLSQHCVSMRRTVNVLVQVNIDEENSKSGVSVQNAPVLCNTIAQLPALKLRGLMVIPAPRDTFDAQRSVFARTRKLLHTINQDYGLAMDSLSMGMSNDFEAAIAEGSTIVRIGRALLGERNK